MRIGIDLGGTKIEGLVLDKGGVERERRRVPTPASSYEEDIEAILDLIAGLERQAGTRCTIGVAHPGAISPATGLVKNANSTRLNGRPLKTDPDQGEGYSYHVYPVAHPQNVAVGQTAAQSAPRPTPPGGAPQPPRIPEPPELKKLQAQATEDFQKYLAESEPAKGKQLKDIALESWRVYTLADAKFKQSVQEVTGAPHAPAQAPAAAPPRRPSFSAA